MKLAISNLAWETKDDKTIFSLMRKYGFSGLEIAPKKIFPDIRNTPSSAVSEYKSYIKREGLDIVAIQAFLFNEPDLQLFGTLEQRNSLIQFCKRVVDVASILGARVIVFGAPKNRSNLNLLDAISIKEIALPFFSEIGYYAWNNGITFGMEANPAIYGTDFVNTTQEALDLVHEAGTQGFSLHLDLGAVTLNQESFNRDWIKEACHVHVSEPKLVQIMDKNNQHNNYALALKEESYSKWISIEMLPAVENNILGIEKSLSFVSRIYG